MELNETVSLLTWDSDFFGFNVARIIPRALEQCRLNSLLDNQWSNGVRLVYWATDHLDQVAQTAALSCGGLLADRKITYRRLTQPIPSSGEGKSKLVESLVKDSWSVEIDSLAMQIGQYSRFKLDIGFPPGAWVRLYQLWMLNSINRSIVDEVLVIRENGSVAGLVTIRIRDGVGEIGLLGVLEQYRGLGNGAALVCAALRWLCDRGVPEAIVVTQGENKAARGLYEHSGFSVSSIDNFYHFWSPDHDSL